MSIDKKLLDLEEKKELIKKFFSYIESSKMVLEEKQMWIAIIPFMELVHIRKLVHLLEKEVNAYANLYLSALDTKF